jgi:hypothetical protein
MTLCATLTRRVMATARPHMVFVSLSMFRVLMIRPHGRDITECPASLSDSEEQQFIIINFYHDLPH